MNSLIRFAAVLSLVPALASASVVWDGGFETGDISQWTKAQAVSGRLQVVTDVVREGKYALRATVRQGDDPISSSGNRNELVYMSNEKLGSTYFYKWSTLFPKSYPSEDTWQVFAQWHHNGCCGSPPLEFYVNGEEMHLRVGGTDGKVLWTAPLVREEWNDFVMEVKWSSNAKEGYVELRHNGKVVVERTLVATQYSGDDNYLKLGLYRNESIGAEASVYHDGFVMATALEDVLPPPPPAPPAPAPVVAMPEPEPVPAAPALQPAPVAEAPAVTPPLAPEAPAAPGPVAVVPVAVVPVAGVETPAAVQDGSPSLFTGDQAGTGGSAGESVTVVPTRAGVAGPQAQGCAATGTGGVPLVAAAALLLLAPLLARRRRTVAVVARRPQR